MHGKPSLVHHDGLGVYAGLPIAAGLRPLSLARHRPGDAARRARGDGAHGVRHPHGRPPPHPSGRGRADAPRVDPDGPRPRHAPDASWRLAERSRHSASATRHSEWSLAMLTPDERLSIWSSAAAPTSTAPARPASSPTSASRTAGSPPSAPSRSRSAPSTRVVDATGQWVMPGFVDAHTHYDAEVQVAPGLNESVRHGVTTVLVGNCSLSTVYSTPLDIADLFSRVEALPRTHVLAALEDAKTWSTPQGWVDALEQLPLGPHVASFLGHSDVRASVMGMGRSTDPAHKATKDEQAEIERRLEDALDAGFLGISTMTNPWDKLDGDRYRSRSLPSTYSSWKEFRGLSRVLRRRGRVLQGVPNLNKKYDIAFYLTTAMGLFRKPLKVSLLAAADTKAEPWVQRIFAPLAFIANKLGPRQVQLAAPADDVPGVGRRHRPRGVRGVRLRPRGAAPARGDGPQRAAERRGLPPLVPSRLRQAVLAAGLAPRLRRRRDHRVPRGRPGRHDDRSGRARPRAAPRRLLPRPGRRARHQAALEDQHRQHPPGGPGQADQPPRRHDRVLRRRRSPAQHGVLQLRHPAAQPRPQGAGRRPSRS